MNKQVSYQYVVRRNGLYITAIPMDNRQIESYIRRNIIPASALQSWIDEDGDEKFGAKNFDPNLSFTELLMEVSKLGFTFEQTKCNG